MSAPILTARQLAEVIVHDYGNVPAAIEAGKVDPAWVDDPEVRQALHAANEARDEYRAKIVKVESLLFEALQGKR